MRLRCDTVRRRRTSIGIIIIIYNCTVGQKPAGWVVIGVRRRRRGAAKAPYPRCAWGRETRKPCAAKPNRKPITGHDNGPEDLPPRLCEPLSFLHWGRSPERRGKPAGPDDSGPSFRAAPRGSGSYPWTKLSRRANLEMTWRHHREFNLGEQGDSHPVASRKRHMPAHMPCVWVLR